MSDTERRSEHTDEEQNTAETWQPDQAQQRGDAGEPVVVGRLAAEGEQPADGPPASAEWRPEPPDGDAAGDAGQPVLGSLEAATWGGQPGTEPADTASSWGGGDPEPAATTDEGGEEQPTTSDPASTWGGGSSWEAATPAWSSESEPSTADDSSWTTIDSDRWTLTPTAEPIPTEDPPPGSWTPPDALTPTGETTWPDSATAGPGDGDVGTAALENEMAGAEAAAGSESPATEAGDAGAEPEPSTDAADAEPEPESTIEAAADDDEVTDPGAAEGIAKPGEPPVDRAAAERDDASTILLSESAREAAGGLEQVKADRVVIRQGGAGQVEAREVHIFQGGAGRVDTEQLHITQGGVGFARTSELELSRESNAFIVIADEVEVESGSRIAILLARTVSGDVRPTLDVRSAIAFGAAFAFVGAVLRRLRGR